MNTNLKHRFFYRDPLAAAWMGKHFGMVFFTPEDDNYHEEVYGWEGVAGAFEYDGAERVYVHPDSLPLLEPKNGDKVSYSYGVGQHAGEAWDEVKGIIPPGDEGYPYTGNGEPYVLVDGCDEFPLSRLTNIFQRDGKPFIWPESEAV